MSWTFEPEFDAAHRAALTAMKPLVYVAPPAVWATAPLLSRLDAPPDSGPTILALTPHASIAVELATHAGRLLGLARTIAVTGLARASRTLASRSAHVIVAAPADAHALVTRAALKLDAVRSVLLVWPELMDGRESVDTLLSDARHAQRLIVTSDPDATGDLVERHARRAPVVRTGDVPETPTTPARYATTGAQQVAWTLRAALDVLDPASAVVWDPGCHARTFDPGVRDVADTDVDSSGKADLAIATDVPSAGILERLALAAREVLVLARPHQLPYLRRIASPLRVLRLPSETDRARDRAAQLRAAVRRQVAGGGHLAHLTALAPLFDELDPAEVAAAAVGIGTGVGEGEAPGSRDFPTWVRLRLEAGQRDRIRPADVVGALINALGVPRAHLGRVDIRESFTLVEVRADAAEQILRGIHELRLKGRPVAASVDRR